MTVKKRPKPVVRKGVSRQRVHHDQTVRNRLRVHKLNEGLPPLPELEMELQDMIDVLLGRAEPPFNAGTMTLMEVSDSYFARASEIQMLIQQGERVGSVPKGGEYYKFRTGELRTFLEMAKRAADLGSRRLSEEQLEFERQKLGRESR